MRNGRTIRFRSPVLIEATAATGGVKECEGPLGKYFDYCLKDDLLGQKSHELAEIKMHIGTIKRLLNKTKLKISDIDFCFAGDLMDEIEGASLTMRDFDVGFFGLYNACSTFAEALILGATMLDAGHASRVICSTSSHFCTAERQYRFPLEYGSQRPPLAQWTVTGSGATMLNKRFGKVAVVSATVGRVVDYGVTDANDMGAAMAPAARDTLLNHLANTDTRPEDYDLIATGDLGEAGSHLMRLLMREEGIELGERYVDCGALIFNRVAQDVGQGGSGAACSATVFNGYLHRKMTEGMYRRVLLIPTGALLSKTSALQGESIPGIAHAVCFERVE